jgi:Sugar-transfer associated ATP-grasp
MKTHPFTPGSDVETSAFDPGSIVDVEIKPDMAATRTLAPAHAWRQWIAFDHSRILLPQFVFRRGHEPLAQIYRLSLEEGEPRAMAGAWARFWSRPIFALVVLRQMWLFFRRYGSFVKKKYAISSFQQIKDLWHCAWRQNQSPRHYYWRKLYLIPNRSEWLENLEHRQVNTLLNHLNRNLPITKVTNKVQFYQHCIDHNLPTAPILTSWDTNGQMVSGAPAAVAADVFLKPTSEYGSVGIMAVVYQPATGKHRLKDTDLAWPDLLKAIGRLASADHRAMLLQRRLANAPRSAVYGEADICNVRVVTGRAPGGEPEVIGGFVRLPSSLTTTGHDRNVMIASIDVVTGRMESGRFRETMLGDFPVHPDTGVKIEKEIFASWGEMKALAIRGHRTYPWMPFIGWDVVDTTDGLLLLEANAYWGGDCVQLPGAMPLGRTNFAKIYLENFEHFYGPDIPAHRFPI